MRAFWPSGSSAPLSTSEALRCRDWPPNLSLTSWLASRILTSRALQFLRWPLSTISYFPYRPEQMHWFCKPSPAFRTHHLHLVPLGSKHWYERLAFRDYLRGNPATAKEYAELKLRLATQYKFDREGYTEAKGPFIQRILQPTM